MASVEIGDDLSVVGMTRDGEDIAEHRRAAVSAHGSFLVRWGDEQRHCHDKDGGYEQEKRRRHESITPYRTTRSVQLATRPPPQHKRIRIVEAARVGSLCDFG
jgi:hypothetical protein